MAKNIGLPLDYNNSEQWRLYNLSPRERRALVLSSTVTIIGEAPSGSHEAEKRWLIWKETSNPTGSITKEYAREGANNLQWIYAESSFIPEPNPNGAPYYIQLDSQIVIDGMIAGMPVANITVFDIDGGPHTITDIVDEFSMFSVSGTVLALTGTASLADIAYPVKLRAVDGDGKEYTQWFTITVNPVVPVTPTAPFTDKPLVMGKDYDNIGYVYPTTTSEVITYSLAGVTVRVISIDYATAAKTDITNVAIA